MTINDSQSLVVLGSTGSIGTSTLEVIRRLNNFHITALSANKNWEKLVSQIQEFKPDYAVICDLSSFNRMKSLDLGKTQLLFGEEGLLEVCQLDEVDVVMASMVGASGLKPFMKALEKKKKIALANKEILVMAGEYLHRTYGDAFLNLVIPVDSEHSAIYQCLRGESLKEVDKLILTASGGPFRQTTCFKNITVEEALSHPNWSMGPKISIDSATMMNKGFEVIEAYWLFPVKEDQIDVIIHPESYIHSMVSFIDGSVIAHLGPRDMKIPIQFSLTQPFRLETPFKGIDWTQMKSLTFEEPDLNRFPCLGMAYDVLKKGNIYPCALNALNEVGVEAFLEGKIEFKDIPYLIEEILFKVKKEQDYSLEILFQVDQQMREEARAWVVQNGIKN